jgi:hypothetical protein
MDSAWAGGALLATTRLRANAALDSARAAPAELCFHLFAIAALLAILGVAATDSGLAARYSTLPAAARFALPAVLILALLLRALARLVERYELCWLRPYGLTRGDWLRGHWQHVLLLALLLAPVSIAGIALASARFAAERGALVLAPLLALAAGGALLVARVAGAKLEVEPGSFASAHTTRAIPTHHHGQWAFALHVLTNRMPVAAAAMFASLWLVQACLLFAYGPGRASVLCAGGCVAVVLGSMRPAIEQLRSLGAWAGLRAGKSIVLSMSIPALGLLAAVAPAATALALSGASRGALLVAGAWLALLFLLFLNACAEVIVLGKPRRRAILALTNVLVLLSVLAVGPFALALLVAYGLHSYRWALRSWPGGK